MDRTKKEQIDKTWRGTPIGEFVDCYLRSDKRRAKEIKQELFNEHYYGGIADYLELNVAGKIVALIETPEEWEDYLLNEIYKENPKLSEALYYTGVFDSFQNTKPYKDVFGLK